ncbi:MAG: TonB-dependent receptor [Thermodesulfobacteriota bacterium]|nr:TonB-dependent receptor [Thermodesulfobacteriota bacterium]
MKVQRWGRLAGVAAVKNRSSKWLACVLAAVLLNMLPPDWAVAAGGDVRAALTVDEIVVTASRVEEKAKEVAANVTVIDEEEIKASTARTLGEILAEKAVGHIRKDFTAALNLAYTGKKDVDDWLNAGPPTWVAPVVEEGGFTVATLTVSKKILDFDRFGGLTLRGEINNLFDKDYEYVKNYPMPGRSFFFSLRYDI